MGKLNLWPPRRTLYHIWHTSSAAVAQAADEEKREAESLIGAIRGMKVSAATKKELDEYVEDINEGEFELMDLRYLRALKERLSA